MSERVDAAYKTLNDAVNELMAAVEEEQQTEDAWVVSHYAMIVGQQRFEDGCAESAETLILPFGGGLTYPLEGLLGKVPQLMLQHEGAEL